MISLALQQFLHDHSQDDTDQLAFQAGKYPDIDMPVALQQLKGRRTAELKIPTWAACTAVFYPRQLSMEQCSSEVTARFKASLVQGDSLVDLTGGLGVDFFFMAQKIQQAVYVEQQAELEHVARYNFQVLNLRHVETVCADSVDYLTKMKEPVDVIFIDPARRNHFGQKTVLLQDCTPDLTLIDDLLLAKSRHTLIKLSPMLDITATIRSLKQVADVYVLAVQNEVKELLLSKKQGACEVRLQTVNFLKDGSQQMFSYRLEDESKAVANVAGAVQRYLYEPNAAVLKAGAYKILAQDFSLDKLHVNSHLYTSDSLVVNFPGRTFEVVDTFSFAKLELKRLHQVTSKGNIAVRNFPLAVDALRKKLKMSDGGDHYLFATTLANQQKVIILTRKAK